MTLAEHISNDSELAEIGFVFIVISGIAALLAIFVVWTRWDSSNKAKDYSENSSDNSVEQSEEELREKQAEKPNPFRKDAKKAQKWRPEKQRDIRYEHQWLLASLRGHTDRVVDLDFSCSGTSLVSISSDRSLFLWNVKDFAEREHKFVRGNVELDNPTHVKFSPDSKSVLLSLEVANKLAVYKVVRKEDSHSYRFQQAETVDFPQIHARDIRALGIACNGKFIMSAAEDNQIAVYSLRGELLKTMELKLNMLYEALVSPCGRFIAASGFTPDVFVFEVLFDRQGVFQDVKKAFELKGHTSGILSFDFNQDSSRCVTASKDGTWKLFNTDIRYFQGEEAKLLASDEWDLLRNNPPENVHISISPSGKSFVIGANRHIQLFSTLRPEKQFKIILDIHQEPLTRVRISPCGRMLATCGDRHIHIFKNIAEYYSEVISLEEAVTHARGDAPKRRLQEQLADAKKQFKSVATPEHV